MVKKILVAIDGSEGAGRALELAAGMAAEANASLWIVNVIGNFGFSPDELEQFRRTEGGSIVDVLESLSGQWLNEAREKAALLGATDVHLVSHTGDVAEAIIGAARDCSAGVIVVGRRGRGLMRELMLGSVSQKLASVSPRPVLIVP